MAKKDFRGNLGSRKSKNIQKLSDEAIEAAFEESKVETKTTPKPKPKPKVRKKTAKPLPVIEAETERLYLRVPKHLHDRLKAISKRMGVSKSAIVKQGVTVELDRLEGL